MNLLDYIGKRGERIFSVLLTKWCDGHPWFDDVFLGEKAEAKDFLVNLISPTSGDASFFVQVKATASGYTGTGAKRKLTAKVTREDVEKLKKVPAPTYIVGIDVDRELGYVTAITHKSKRGLSGIPTTHPLNCATIKRLWKEIDDYWTAAKKKMPKRTSEF